MRRRVEPTRGRGRLAPLRRADRADAVRCAELATAVCMAWFDALPPEGRAAERRTREPVSPPPEFVRAELARRGALLGPHGLTLPEDDHGWA